MKQKIFLFLFLIFTILLDLESKNFLKNKFSQHRIKFENTTNEEKTIYITRFLNFKNLCNYGVSFGILNNINQKYLSIFIGIIFISILIYSYFFIALNKINLLALTILSGGAIANLIDRIQNGCVYDFIDLHINEYHFYVFNIADSFITIGAILLFINSFRKN